MTLIKKQGRVELHKIGHKNHEVIVRVRSRGKYAKKIDVQGTYSAYPSTSLWGTYGFTYIDIENAKIKFEELVKQYQES